MLPLSYAAFPLTLYPSYHAILLMLPPFWCPLIISTAELPSFVGSVHLTSVACSSGLPDKSDHRQTLWGGKFIFYEIHRRRQPCSESILRGIGLFCETILLHRRQQPYPEVSPRHIGGFSELHDGRTFFASEGNESHFPWTS